jgi:hypothetical protein
VTALNRVELKEVLIEIFEERARISNEDHSEHHEWIKERIRAEQERRAMYHVITTTFVQYSLPVLLAAAWYWLQGHLK